LFIKAGAKVKPFFLSPNFFQSFFYFFSSRFFPLLPHTLFKELPLLSLKAGAKVIPFSYTPNLFLHFFCDFFICLFNAFLSKLL